MPPMYSALKRDGVPLYRLARQGQDVARSSRAVQIDTLELLEVAPPLVSLRVVCSKGTYIRTLCHDLGRQLGCGAHLAALRRTRCGRFGIGECFTVGHLEQLAAAGQALPLIAPAQVLADWPGLQVHDAARARLANGIAPTLTEVNGAAELVPGQPVRLLIDQQLAAVARCAPGGEGTRHGDFLLDKVFPADIAPC
jgi:tRNA pseudouridine55 synthase